MDTFTQALNELFSHEGGFSDHPADTGGATRWGITQRVARGHGWRGSMSKLPKSLAIAIYRRDYWDALSLDAITELSPGVAIELFEQGVNMGTGRAAEHLQRVLNALNRQARDYRDIAVDGDVGPGTLRALDSCIKKRGDRNLLAALNALQGAFYIRLAERRESQESFLNGWLNRVAM